METVLEVLESEKAAEEQQLIELSAEWLDKVGGGLVEVGL
jgi:hypothetical protein